MDGPRSEIEDHDAVGPTEGPGRPGRRKAAWLVTGDEAVVALVGDGTDPSTSVLLTHDSAFLVDGDTVARTRRSGPGVDPYEGEPLADLEGAVEDALR